MNISVVGSGYVGLVGAVCFAELGHDVTTIDNDAAKIALLNSGGTPIFEEYLPELLAKHRGHRLRFSNSWDSIAASDIIFIAVGTPPSNRGDADLSYVEAVARKIAAVLPRSGRKVIVTKSTVPVYTSQWIRRTLLLNGACEDSFEVGSNPEFLREGTAIRDFLYPDRIVIGADQGHARELLASVYAPLTDGSYYDRQDAVPRPNAFTGAARIIVASASSAEMIKHAANAFLATKISFINAVANICEEVGADVDQVCEGIGSDTRIGTRFLNPGVGYGGSCFPKDVAAFQDVAQAAGYDFGLLREVREINEAQRKRFVDKMRAALWTLKGKQIGVLGLAFKAGTDDVRESASVAIIRMLLEEGASVVAFDPVATERAKAELGDSIRYVEDAYAAARDSHALAILTEWPAFAELDLECVRKVLKYPVICDGRNLYRPETVAARGLIYISVGRPEKKAAQGVFVIAGVA